MGTSFRVEHQQTKCRETSPDDVTVGEHFRVSPEPEGSQLSGLASFRIPTGSI